MSKKDDDFKFLPTTYLVVLTLIGHGARYGYEMDQMIQERGYRNWVDIKFSSVYKALDRLEEMGYITGKKTDKSTQTSKKVYSLTKKGKNALEEQMLHCLSSPPRARSLFDLGLSAIPLLKRDDVLSALKQYREGIRQGIKFMQYHIETIDHIDEFKEEQPDRMLGGMAVNDFDDYRNLPVVKILFERPLATLTGQLEWLDEVISRIEDDKDYLLFSDTKE